METRSTLIARGGATDRARCTAGLVGTWLLAALVLVACEPPDDLPGALATGTDAPAVGDPPAPLEGMRLGQPLGAGGAALPPGGLMPCARDPGHARELLERFFSVVRQPGLSEEERAWREESGLPPVVRTRFEPEVIRRAQVIDTIPFLYRIELDTVPEPFAEDDATRYPYLAVWYSIRCSDLEYFNTWFGEGVDEATPYPFGDLDADHLEVWELPAETAPRGVAVEGEPGTAADTMTAVTAEYVNGLPLARTARELADADELSELADLLYRLERIPMSGFNQGGQWLSRDVEEREHAWVIRDRIEWTVWDDQVVPGQDLPPPHVFELVHVIIYEPASRRVAHYRWTNEDGPEEGPTVGIVRPGEGRVVGEGSPRALRLQARVAHGGEILDPDRMEWRSDRDGRLALGLRARLAEEGLSPGEHRITFQACDRQGRCSEDHVNIQVRPR